MDNRRWLDVPYREKDAAKAAGARWNPQARRWYALDDRASLNKWDPDYDAMPLFKPADTVTTPPPLVLSDALRDLSLMTKLPWATLAPSRWFCPACDSNGGRGDIVTASVHPRWLRRPVIRWGDWEWRHVLEYQHIPAPSGLYPLLSQELKSPGIAIRWNPETEGIEKVRGLLVAGRYGV